MRTITRVFEEISIKRTKRWVDENGKRRQETRKFWQTISPFNKNKKGQIKTVREIQIENNEEAQKWMEQNK